MSGYSPHAHVQRVYGRRKVPTSWACGAPGCSEERRATSVPLCPVHRVPMQPQQRHP